MVDEANRRRYKRVQAPVYCRPLGKQLFGTKQQPINVSQGGLRIYADDEARPGERLEIELFLPDGTSVTCEVEIVWVDELPPSAPARFDVGLKFLSPGEALLDRLAAVLEESSKAGA